MSCACAGDKFNAPSASCRLLITYPLLWAILSERKVACVKFTRKIILSITMILCVLFSAAGIWMIQANFKNSLEKTISQKTQEHLLERYGMENYVMSALDKEGNIPWEEVESYAGQMVSYLSNDKKILIYRGEEEIYSNCSRKWPQSLLRQLLKGEQIRYQVEKIQKKHWILTASSLEINRERLTWISVYDISDVYWERDRQLEDFYVIDGMILIVCAVAVGLLACLLTAPIRRLNEVSKQIAGGSYEQRVGITTTDEIGELGASFNKMADTVQGKIEELEDMVRQREEFVANFSHELKTPMTSIIGYADLLRTKQMDENKRQKALLYIFQEGKRLENLSYQLMDLMGLSENKITCIPMNIKKWMMEFIRRMEARWQWQERQMKIVCHVQEETVLGDQCLLEECLGNLVENAKKSEPKDGIITIIGKRIEDKYYIAVEDKGCGIPSEEICKVTESFYMVDKARSRNQGGSGIGLSLCEKIVRLHGSSLKIESTLGEGTIVSFFLDIYMEK